MTHLSQHETYACGTMLSNCKGLPDEVKNAKLQQKEDLLQLQKVPFVPYKDNELDHCSDITVDLIGTYGLKKEKDKKDLEI